MRHTERGIAVKKTETTYVHHWSRPILSNSDLYEHKYLENIKKLYWYAGKFDYKQQYKAIL